MDFMDQFMSDSKQPTNPMMDFMDQFMPASKQPTNPVMDRIEKAIENHNKRSTEVFEKISKRNIPVITQIVNLWLSGKNVTNKLPPLVQFALLWMAVIRIISDTGAIVVAADRRLNNSKLLGNILPNKDDIKLVSKKSRIPEDTVSDIANLFGLLETLGVKLASMGFQQAEKM